MLRSTLGNVLSISVYIFFFSLTFRVRGQDLYLDGLAEDTDDCSVPDDLLQSLRTNLPGITYPYEELSAIMTATWLQPDQCELQFNSGLRDLVSRNLLVGSSGDTNQIISVTVSLFMSDGDPVRNPNGEPVQLCSTRHNFGHFLDGLDQYRDFASARCLLRFQPNSNFNLHHIFFHCPSLSGEPISTPFPFIIYGPVEAFSDSMPRTYNTTSICIGRAQCMWLLSDRVVGVASSTELILRFQNSDIGTQVLTYRRFRGNRFTILASLTIVVKPFLNLVCTNLGRLPKNMWLPAGYMHRPRTLFTATYMAPSDIILLAGGTSDNTNALASVEFFNFTSGCYRILVTSSRRMEHSATYDRARNQVYLVGGRDNSLYTTVPESISLFSVDSTRPATLGRYGHQAVMFPNASHILFAGGQIQSGSEADSFRFFTNDVSNIQISVALGQSVNGLRGHTVTKANESYVFILGGQRNGTCAGVGLRFNGTHVQNLTTEAISRLRRANHQATYIPTLRAILVTGGNNVTHVLNDAFLIDVDSTNVTSVFTMNTARTHHADVLLSNQSVLIIGGALIMNNGQPTQALDLVQRYDVNVSLFSSDDLMIARFNHKAIGTVNNEVFVFGGESSGTVLTSALNRAEYIMYQ